MSGRPVLVLVAVLVFSSACTKKESLVLLDLRTSGPLGAPVARVRLSAPGGKTRTITGEIGPAGFRVGYYGPSDDGTLSVTAEALDGVDCMLGRGSATVTDLESGGTSAPTTLFIRPLPSSGCAVVDAGGGNQDAGADTSTETDAGTDTSPDAGTDTPATDAPTNDAGGTDAPAEASATDAGADTPTDDGGGPDAGDAPTDGGDDGGSADASAD